MTLCRQDVVNDRWQPHWRLHGSREPLLRGLGGPEESTLPLSCPQNFSRALLRPEPDSLAIVIGVKSPLPPPNRVSDQGPFYF